MDDILNASDSNDGLDLLDDQSAPEQSTQQDISGGGIDTMLAQDDSDDDNLFGQPSEQSQQQQNSQQQQQQPLEKSSALILWQKEKDAQLREIDAKEEQEKSEAAEKAKQALTGFYKKLEEGHNNRAKHNLDRDQQFIADRDSTATKMWEKVVTFIDFNRSDLHERDVSRMKTLLLQLKH